MKLKTKNMIDGVRHVFVREAEGLGDVVAHVLHTGPMGRVVKAVTGMDKPCGGCDKRRKWLNEKFPMKAKV